MQSALGTEQEDRDTSMQEPRAPLSTRRDSINQLPAEVLITVFRKSLDSARPGKDLVRLGLVCHFWRSIFESTPSLWAYINAADGIQHIQTAVRKTGEMPLELAYRAHNDYATMAVDDFLTVVMESLNTGNRWKFYLSTAQRLTQGSSQCPAPHSRNSHCGVYFRQLLFPSPLNYSMGCPLRPG